MISGGYLFYHVNLPVTTLLVIKKNVQVVRQHFKPELVIYIFHYTYNKYVFPNNYIIFQIFCHLNIICYQITVIWVIFTYSRPLLQGARENGTRKTLLRFCGEGVGVECTGKHSTLNLPQQKKKKIPVYQLSTDNWWVLHNWNYSVDCWP